MLQFFISELGLLNLSPEKVAVFSKYCTNIHVIPLIISYDGSIIDPRFAQQHIAEFHKFATGADYTMFNIRLSRIKLEDLNDTQDVLCILPERKIFSERISDQIQTTLYDSLGVDSAVYNINCISTAYGEKAFDLIEKLADAKDLREAINRLSFIEDERPITQLLYISHRKEPWLKEIRNAAVRRHRPYLIKVGRQHAFGVGQDAYSVASEIGRVVKMRHYDSAKITIYGSGLPFEEVFYEAIRKECPQATVVMALLDPVTAICAGYGAMLFEIEKA